MTGTGAANWTWAGGPQTAAASRPPGTRNDRGPGQGPGGVGEELEALAAEHGVEAGLGNGQLLGVGLDEVEVAEAGGRGPLAGQGQHRGRDVGADHPPAGPGRPGGGQAGLAVAGGQVEHDGSRADPGQLDQPAAHGQAGPGGLEDVGPGPPAGRGVPPLGPDGRLVADGIDDAGR